MRRLAAPRLARARSGNAWPKGDIHKIKLASSLRAETTMTIKWIAQRLQMGTWTYANSLLYRNRQK